MLCMVVAGSVLQLPMLQHPYDSCLPTIIIQQGLQEQGLQEQGLLFSTISLTLPCLPFLHRLPRLDYIKLAVEGDIRPSSISTVLYSLRTQLKGRMRSMHVYLEQSWVGAEEAWRELGRSTALNNNNNASGPPPNPVTP
jgi:hypothetical protein